jgi:hypothetical protein
MNELKFKCCFCKQSIESNKTDPCDINILINFDKSKEKQYSQSFYCHLNCFKEKLHEDMKQHLALHLLIDDE